MTFPYVAKLDEVIFCHLDVMRHYLVVFVIYLAGPLPKAGAIIAELIVMFCYLLALLVALPGLQKRPEAPPGVVLRQMESDGV